MVKEKRRGDEVEQGGKYEDLEFSLRAQSEMFLGVFSDFDKCRKDWAEKRNSNLLLHSE